MTIAITIRTAAIARKALALTALMALGWDLQAQDTKDTAVLTAADTTVAIKAPPPKNTVPVSGIITEAVGGKALRGVRVTYRDLYATITDSAGAFTLNVPDYQVTIRVEGDGFQSKEISLRGAKRISAALHEDNFTSLYDEVATPFGPMTQSRVNNASVSVQNTNNWQNTPETPDAFLQGKVAGLNAIRRSGTPNSGANLFLRGFSSLYATNQPLIIVDGVFFDISTYGTPLTTGFYNNPFTFIDNKDIDNITVIKDATSLYGAKGANGVILITTARARQEATRIDASLYGGINFAPQRLPVMNATDYRSYLAEMLQSKGMSAKDMQALPYMNDDPANPDYYRYHYNTDWQDKVMGNSYAENGHLKITGGDNIAKYALSIGFLKNRGIIRTTDLTRYNTRFNADFNLSKKLSASANLSFLYNEQKPKNTGTTVKTNPLFNALLKSPFLPDHDVADNGAESPALAGVDSFGMSNPSALIQGMQAINKSYRFNGTVNFKYLLSKYWALGETISVTLDKIRESYFIPQRGVVSDTLGNAVAVNQSGAQVIRNFTFFNDAYLHYNRTFNRLHQLDLRVGLRYVKSSAEQDNGFGFNAATDQLTGVQYGLNSLRSIGGSMGDWKWLNSYFAANYNIAGKYLLTVNLAADASSRFGSNVKSSATAIDAGDHAIALFPSVAGAWIISSEKFMQQYRFVDLLKLRVSAGITGNDDIGNYTARKYYTAQNLLGISGLVRGNVGNEQLQWESVQKLNAGLDVALFNERLTVSFDAYRHQTSKMIVYQPLGAASGFDYTATNSGGMRTSGWELSATARIINHAGLKWDLGFNIARYKSVVTDLPSGSFTTDYAGATMITQVGSAPNMFYGYRTNGIYTTNAAAAAEGLSNRNSNGSTTPFRGGDVRFVDYGDKVIDAGDRSVIGNPNPDYYGGVNSRVSYKSWTLDLLCTFSVGNEVYNYTRRQLESMSGYGNQLQSVDNRWRTDGQVTNMPRATWGDPMGNSRFSDRWIEDGSYFRIRTASVSYNIPIKPGAVKYTTVFVTGTNLLTFTKYLGYDPEVSAGPGVYGQGLDILQEPQYRSVQAGLRIGL
ncbi:MAG: SusC/RagA family TonB-linked outer membrane protein [Bacteroidetes bacterium]|nr:SusC/RagA family TonB-linked outer membrane protein [Bacteroidota bacterium]